MGCGRIGTKRVGNILANQDTELVCVVDYEEELAENVAKEAGCTHYQNYEDAVRRTDVDCIVIATPNVFHLPISIESLNHGKHVLCEKPLARNPREARAIVRKAIEKNRFVKVGSYLRYFATVKKAKELIDGDAIGELMFLRGSVGIPWKWTTCVPLWFSDAEKAGGGSFLDNGHHILDLARWFIGEIEECKGYVSTSYWDISVEDNGFGLFKTLNGKVASIHSSWTDWSGGYFDMQIFGKDGYIIINERNKNSEVAYFGKDDVRGATQVFDYSKEPHNSFALEFEHFVKTIQEGRQPLASGYDGMRAVQMAHAIYRSSTTGKTVKIFGKIEKAIKNRLNF